MKIVIYFQRAFDLLIFVIFLLLLDAKGNKLKKCEIQNKRFIFYKLTILDF